MNDYSEDKARKYIRNLIISGNKQILQKALLRYEKRYGHKFWEINNPAYEKAKDIFGI